MYRAKLISWIFVAVSGGRGFESHHLDNVIGHMWVQAPSSQQFSG